MGGNETVPNISEDPHGGLNKFDMHGNIWHVVKSTKECPLWVMKSTVPRNWRNCSLFSNHTQGCYVKLLLNVRNSGERHSMEKPLLINSEPKCRGMLYIAKEPKKISLFFLTNKYVRAYLYLHFFKTWNSISFKSI